MCSLYDGNLLSLKATTLNLPSCFSTTGSVEHIISVNTIESGLSTASGRGGFNRLSIAVITYSDWSRSLRAQPCRGQVKEDPPDCYNPSDDYGVI